MCVGKYGVVQSYFARIFLVLVANSDVPLDIDDVALVRSISFGCFAARSKKRDSQAEA